MRNMRNTLSTLHSLITRPEGNPPASQSSVAALPAVVVLLEDVESGAACCTVCNEVAEVGEEVVRLPCRHLYHGACIRQWLGVRNMCPMCRFELPTDDIGKAAQACVFHMQLVEACKLGEGSGQVVQSGAVKEVQLAQAGCSANAVRQLPQFPRTVDLQNPQLRHSPSHVAWKPLHLPRVPHDQRVQLGEQRKGQGQLHSLLLQRHLHLLHARQAAAHSHPLLRTNQLQGELSQPRQHGDVWQISHVRSEAAKSFGQLEGRMAGGTALDEQECLERGQVAEGVW
ncbi:unnamed protein product [Closterium sp. NIES-64]|nr:unnamed protein product [Closterium sp. NIES-64]